MRLHVVGLPHTRLTAEYSWCAYTQKVVKFAQMMTEVGCDVITYGNGEADLPGKYVKVTDVTYEPFFVPEFDATNFVFANFNDAATAAIYEHIEPGDIICVIGGNANQPLAANLSHWPIVEWGIGYSGVFAKYKVWESHCWENHVAGIMRTQGSDYDTVIYNYFDPAEFASYKDRDYYAYLGRITHCKGVDTAIAACREVGVPLKIAGHIFADCEYVRHLEGDIEYVGDLGPAERKKLLGHAIATFCPSRYIEPFCGVHVESMLSGTPVLTTDWGVFTETVTNGEEGWRCRSLEEFTLAMRRSRNMAMSAHELRQRAIERYSMDVIGPQYLEYLERIV